MIGLVERTSGSRPGAGPRAETAPAALRVRAGRREQRHLVAALGQLRGEQRQHLLDAAVSGRRHLDPGRAQASRSSSGLLPSPDVYPGGAGHAVRMGSPLGALANLAETIVIKDGNVFLVTLPRRPPAGGRASIRWASGSGTAASSARTSCASAAQLPRLLTATDAAGTEAVHELTNPDLELRDGGRVPAESLRLRMERTVEAEGALRQRIAVRSYHRAADPAAARAAPRRGLPSRCSSCAASCRSTSAPAPDAGPDGLLAGGARRRAPHHSRFARRPRRASCDDGSLVFDLDLEARGGDRPGGGLRGLREQRTARSGAGASAQAPPRTAPRSPPTTSSSTGSSSARSTTSSCSAPSSTGSPTTPPACPWFATLFGRDSLITSFQTLSFVRGIAGGDAAAAGRPARAGVQRRARRGAGQGPPRAARGRAGGARRDAVRALLRLAWTPRRCSSACSAGTPTGPATSTCSASCAGPPRRRSSGSTATRDLDGDGLVEYQRRSPHGLVTQGWKDSADGVPDDDGEPLSGAGRARGGAGLRDPREAPDGAHVRARRRRRARRAAARRGRRARGGARALLAAPTRTATRSALDGDKRPGSGLTSNQGHLLWCQQRERRARPRDPRRPDVGRHVHRLGRPDAGVEPSGLQPGGLPHRLRVAARQRADRVRAAPLRLRRGLHAASSRGCSRPPPASTTTACPSCSPASRARSSTSRCPTRWRASRRRGRRARSRSSSSGGSA